MCRVKGRVQKMQIFSKNLHAQPQKSFMLCGVIFNSFGCHRLYVA